LQYDKVEESYFGNGGLFLPCLAQRVEVSAEGNATWHLQYRFVKFSRAIVLEKMQGERVLQVWIPLLLQEMKHVSDVPVRPGW